MTLDARAVETLIELALQEDLGAGDWTTDSLIPPDHQSRGAILAQAEGILCGVEIAKRVFQRLDSAMRFADALTDGARLAPDVRVLTIEGNTRALLKAERTALNFLQHLSGIATRTRQFVDAVAGTGAQIVDTRKTTPALRLLEKYAVRVGGGRNHRVGLYDGILITDNHLAALGGDIAEAVRRARQYAHHLLAVEVECTTLARSSAAG